MTQAELVATYERGVRAYRAGNMERARVIAEELGAHHDFAPGLNFCGSVHYADERYDLALTSYKLALRTAPRDASLHNNCGNALKALGRYEGALLAYDQALRLRPDFIDARFNKANTFKAMGDFSRALEHYDAVLAGDPGHSAAQHNRANTLVELARFDEALAAFDRTLGIDPGHADARHCRGLLRLRLGNFAEGWADYEHRRRAGEFGPASAGAAEWRGEPLAGKWLLCHAEQGLGDTIQFARFASALARDARKVALLPQPELCPLLERLAGVDILNGVPEHGQFDYEVALISIPRLIGLSESDLPVRERYLEARPELVAKWRGVIGDGGLRVGIAWQGNPDERVDRGRSLPLRSLAGLAENPGVTLVSLQKHAGAEQLRDRPAGMRVTDLGDDLDGGGAFLDTAAIMANLDLVVSVDSAVAHLAGALGVRSWVLLKKVPDGRWLTERTDSPWYPDMRLFRQSATGDWESVLREVGLALSALAASDAKAASPTKSRAG